MRTSKGGYKYDEGSRGQDKCLKSLDLYSPKKRRPNYNLQLPHKWSADLFSLMTFNETQGNGKEMHQKVFILYIRRRFFTKNVVGHWNRLPKKWSQDQFC